ncbi:ATP-binding protein [bacterium]|nr:ATP-binding protein [bacterium]
MSVIVRSAVTIGLNITPVTVEAALGSGFSGVQLIGLPQDYARDARERIRAAIESLGMSLPARRLVVSVRPSEAMKQFKSGLEHLDLPCAVAILSALADQQQPPKVAGGNLKQFAHLLRSKNFLFAGQLTLAGEVLALENSLPFEIIALRQQDEDFYICSNRTVTRTELNSSCEPFIQVRSLKECLIKVELMTRAKSAADRRQNLNSLCTIQGSDPHEFLEYRKSEIKSTLDLFTACPELATALSIAAAGRHHILLAGSPGCGKTFALRHLAHLLPPLTEQERMDVALIHNRTPENLQARPFRSPHHSASAAALLGGSSLQPGEVSLAHHGILFLDELAEFPRPTLEALREPLDEKKISLARARGRVELPAGFMLASATNPCPCGFYFSRFHNCRCLTHSVSKYQQKLSGPLLERFSILLLVDHLQEMPALNSANGGTKQTMTEDSPLRQLSLRWLAQWRQDPMLWVERLLKIQHSFWTKNDEPLGQGNVQKIHESIEFLTQKEHWSARTRTRLRELTLTMSALFPEEFAVWPVSDFIAVAVALRGFEGALQKGVQFLTPSPWASILKDRNESHDTHPDALQD